MFADKLFINGKFYTMRNKGHIVEALVVKNGNIIFTGTTEEALKYQSDEIIDLKNSVVLPGFIDSHMHLAAAVENIDTVDLGGVKSLNEVVELLKNKSLEIPDNEWIVASSLDEAKFNNSRLLNRYDLKVHKIKNPILIRRLSGHSFTVNDKALELAGIDRSFASDHKDIFDIDEKGFPTGIINTQGMKYFSHLLNKSLEKKIKKTYDLLKLASSYGLTTLHTFSLKSMSLLDYFDVYYEINRKYKLPIRIIISFDELPRQGIKTGFGNTFLKYGCYKIFCDGALSTYSAFLSRPYADKDKCYGYANHTAEELNKLVSKACEMDLDVAFHAIGDRAIKMALDAIEGVKKRCKYNSKRFRLIHGMVLNKSLISKIRNLNIILDVQPSFLFNAFNYAQKRLGSERLNYFMPFRSLIDQNILLTGGSDFPVSSLNPFMGIYAAVTRESINNSGQLLNENQRISVYEAISLYTKNASYCCGEESMKGTLEPGKVADFIILDKDPFRIPSGELKDIRVIETYVNGEKVY